MHDLHKGDAVRERTGTRRRGRVVGFQSEHCGCRASGLRLLVPSVLVVWNDGTVSQCEPNDVEVDAFADVT